MTNEELAEIGRKCGHLGGRPKDPENALAAIDKAQGLGKAAQVFLRTHKKEAEQFEYIDFDDGLKAFRRQKRLTPAAKLLIQLWDKYELADDPKTQMSLLDQVMKLWYKVRDDTRSQFEKNIDLTLKVAQLRKKDILPNPEGDPDKVDMQEVWAKVHEELDSGEKKA